MSRTEGWNPWHGCHKFSSGCLNCYVYRIDRRAGRDSSIVTKTADFTKPAALDRHGGYKIPSGATVYTCFSSDFFLEEADAWRPAAWEMISQRRDLQFYIVTKRIHRFAQCTPPDWGRGYENVTVSCTVEDQAAADRRLPLFLEAPIRHREINCEPLLEQIDLERWLGGWIEKLTAGGESGENARACDYAWVQSLRTQCARRGVEFYFKQTGANFRP